jgi:hypothetical protein
VIGALAGSCGGRRGSKRLAAIIKSSIGPHICFCEQVLTEVNSQTAPST